MPVVVVVLEVVQKAERHIPVFGDVFAKGVFLHMMTMVAFGKNKDMPYFIILICIVCETIFVSCAL